MMSRVYMESADHWTRQQVVDVSPRVCSEGDSGDASPTTVLSLLVGQQQMVLVSTPERAQGQTLSSPTTMISCYSQRALDTLSPGLGTREQTPSSQLTWRPFEDPIFGQGPPFLSP